MLRGGCAAHHNEFKHLQPKLNAIWLSTESEKIEWKSAARSAALFRLKLVACNLKLSSS
jgi:hypothetical protein